MTQLIGIAGAIEHGKDATANAIRFLTSDAEHSLTFEKFLAADDPTRSWKTPWETKRFAYKLKQVVALYLGVSVETLEDRQFKNTPLGPEWTRWFIKVTSKINGFPEKTIIIDKMFGDESDAHDYAEREDTEKPFLLHLGLFDEYIKHEIYSERLTPRLFLQMLGTQGMRDIIHPNIHVNGLFADYKPRVKVFDQYKAIEHNYLPYWLIPDTRFPNEADEIKERGGILIKVVNPRIPIPTVRHESETALDNYKHFDEIIMNDSSLGVLANRVHSQLHKYGVTK